jgi:hypothetical protein
MSDAMTKVGSAVEGLRPLAEPPEWLARWPTRTVFVES